MEIGSATLAGTNVPQQQTNVPERVDRARQASALTSEAPQDEKKVAPEEVLKKIKALTEDGQYGVRFEMDKDINALVIKVYDPKTNEVVRQIPSEDLMKTIKSLQDYRGMLVNEKR